MGSKNFPGKWAKTKQCVALSIQKNRLRAATLLATSKYIQPKQCFATVFSKVPEHSDSKSPPGYTCES